MQRSRLSKYGQAAAELEQLEALSKDALAQGTNEGGAEATDEL